MTAPIYDILKTHGPQIRAVFFGHTHLFLRDEYEGIPLFMTDSMECPSHSEYEGNPMRHYIIQCQPRSGDYTIYNEYMIPYSYTPGDETLAARGNSDLQSQLNDS